MLNYKHFMRQAKALGNAYDFKTYHFWQPVIFTETRELYPSEQTIINSKNVATIHNQKMTTMDDIYKKAYKEVKQRISGDNFYFIADAFQYSNSPTYFDFCHVGPKGNKLIADRIYKEISEQLS